MNVKLYLGASLSMMLFAITGCSDEEKGSDLCHIASKKAPASFIVGAMIVTAVVHLSRK